MMTRSSGISLRRLCGFFSASCLALLLAACGAGPTGVSSTPGRTVPKKVPAVRQPSKAQPPAPQFQSIPGLEGVIGVNRKQLVGLFGEPRLDVWEGDARKLQFTGNACV